jgi:hypothetical protein
MMQVLSLAWGILALLGFMVAFLPCLGSLNWLNIPFAIVGLVISIAAFTTAPPGRRTLSVVGIVLCLIAVLIGAKRLVLGGGVL